MKAHCLGCQRQREFDEFHHIPDVMAFKSVQDSVVRKSATSGEMIVPGRFSTDGGTFIWCKGCNASLSVAKKKELIWYLCTHVHNEADALTDLARARDLCAQIDKGF